MLLTMTSSSTEAVSKEDIHELLEHSVKNTHKVKDGDIKGDFIMEKCLLLFSKDYKYSVITNFNGELCGHYPSKIILLEYQLTEGDQKKDNFHGVESVYDTTQMRELIKQARYARCRSRFAVPVIMYEGKHVCRSATLASGAEMYGRSGLDFLFSGPEASLGPMSSPEEEEPELQMFDRLRGQDKKLLRNLSVKYICDLMVEKKKVKFGMNITSSEKVDKENRYADFHILTTPYPGCEFFKEWKDNSYTGETMMFDWSQDFVDAVLDVPDDPLFAQLGLDWTKYRKWDIMQLTQNYLLLQLHILKEGDSGLLVHCISGWDRTPMFISLLRLSLWADGIIHASLTPTEILYLTLAYDWYLFGHNLPDRVHKGEEILFFCFNFLTHIASDDFSAIKKREPKHVSRNVSRHNSECNIEGVLLDNDPRRLSYRGSNTSISSIGSSSVEGAPTFFSTNESDDDSVKTNGNPSVMIGQQSRHKMPVESPIHFNISHYNNTPSSSSPMAVPNNLRKYSTMSTGSPACGSWQVVSSTGSLRGLVSSHDSPLSDSNSSGGHGSSRPSSCQEATETVIPESQRWNKLDSVRRIFHNAYTNKIIASNGRKGGISNLLDQFAEKVGFKSGKT
ncbi:phosphatidylinositol-3,5-bisphosphate 3-phosphatase MTMR14-like isoform X1 [Mytilus galloprovincialis]|uniref:phosphatidylinositol-3,5-bisphosphate 3-phosphatase MTMR14-like isoform X1 n=1 Tax=Mytilus galloprovincialis TaxID=29158 RepID=UPI003F7C049E